MDKAGHKVNRAGNNLWIVAPGFELGKQTILLNSHIDTVKPVAGWSKDPFAADAGEDDRLYGLGSNDAGASVVSLYEAFTILSKKSQPSNLIFLASCEEEVSGRMAWNWLLPSYLPFILQWWVSLRRCNRLLPKKD
jgi:acetylornithine deacetylase